jgi:hypothetical protein
VTYRALKYLDLLAGDTNRANGILPALSAVLTAMKTFMALAPLMETALTCLRNLALYCSKGTVGLLLPAVSAAASAAAVTPSGGPVHPGVAQAAMGFLETLARYKAHARPMLPTLHIAVTVMQSPKQSRCDLAAGHLA